MKVRLYKRLFVGSNLDYMMLWIANKEYPEETFAYDYKSDEMQIDGWAIVHACKEPWHRNFVGYMGRGCPKDNPEYYWAKRKDRLALNIVDSPNPAFFNFTMIEKALDFMAEKYWEGKNILIHCNEGRSRSPSIAMLFLATRLYALPTVDYEDAVSFMNKYYSIYSPKNGIRQHIKDNWAKYRISSKKK